MIGGDTVVDYGIATGVLQGAEIAERMATFEEILGLCAAASLYIRWGRGASR